MSLALKGQRERFVLQPELLGYITLVKVITRGLFSLLLIMTLLGTSIGELSSSGHYAID